MMNTKSQNPAYEVLLSSNTVNARGTDNAFQLQPLPYTQDALAPYISEQTIQFHYGKHLAAYIENTNKQKAGTEFENKTIEEIMLHAGGSLFNNAAQVYNHYFQIDALQPHRKNEDVPCEKMTEAIRKDFGSVDEFKARFTQAAVTLFGSGYAWLTGSPQENKLEIIQTHNAENPLKEGKIPLLNLDV
ncbi:MAG: superoxide dismutase, partial [Odoribacter sp.]|nr:superoxide dismutase [Odoribacter sp.]